MGVRKLELFISQFSHSVVSDSLRPHGLQHARLPCPSPIPGACSNSHPSSRSCHPTISSSVIHTIFEESNQVMSSPKYHSLSLVLWDGGKAFWMRGERCSEGFPNNSKQQVNGKYLRNHEMSYL